MIARVLIGLISLYRRWVSPLLPPSCRFHPTCSEFALEALRQHGLVKGGALAVHRIGRCHPWSAGGPDPVPRGRA
jgi:uncharacterized protein